MMRLLPALAASALLLAAPASAQWVEDVTGQTRTRANTGETLTFAVDGDVPTADPTPVLALGSCSSVSIRLSVTAGAFTAHPQDGHGAAFDNLLTAPLDDVSPRGYVHPGPIAFFRVDLTGVGAGETGTLVLVCGR